ncbi:MAG: zinc ribbon domain-containing protein, partial [Candidatus Poseidoniaceae archaeon]
NILALSWIYTLIWYGLGVFIGVILLRTTRVTKDHEYRRTEIMKKMKHVYDAEAKGVWEKDVPLQGETQINKEQLNATIGSFGREAPELELDQDTTSEVQMLTEQGFVQKATRRMSGDGAEIDEMVDSTVGSVRKVSWMDGLIDGIFTFFGRDKAAEREEQRLARLRANAQQTPVIAQRPVAPIKETLTESRTSENLTMTSMSDDGGIISSTANEAPTIPVQRKESIEDLAMLSGGSVSTITGSMSGGCPSCGARNPPSERYCQTCGTTLSA